MHQLLPTVHQSNVSHTPRFRDAASRSVCSHPIAQTSRDLVSQTSGDLASQTPAPEHPVSQHLRTLASRTPSPALAQGRTLGGSGGGVSSEGVGLKHKDQVSRWGVGNKDGGDLGLEVSSEG